jgi:adenine deaminase
MTLISAAMARTPADLLITNVRLANVITGEIYPADIAIYGGKIAAIEPPGTEPAREARQVIDGQGRLAVPGLVDAHLHIESTLVTPAHFAEAVLPLGVTTVAEDPHEVANVAGIDGIRTMMAASAHIPLKVEYLISSSVPSAPGLETAGGEIGPDEVKALLALPRVLGLAEVMDGASVVSEDPRALSILAACGGVDGQRVDSPGVIEGHNPMLRGRALSAFIAAGVDSDHTLATPADLVEKARQGVTLMLQERYLSAEAIAALERLPLDIGLCLVTDDVAPDYLLSAGHLDRVLRRVIELGMDPMRALRAATFNPARRLRLWDRGALTPGRAADIVLVDSIEEFRARLVLVDGRVVAEEGRCLWRAPAGDPMDALMETVHLPGQQATDFVIPASIREGEVRIRVIDCVPGQTLVTAGEAVVPVRDGHIELPEDADMAYMAVADRHGVHGGRSFGVVRGLGLTRGALATTYAHDAHNLAVIGRSPAEMALAANAVIDSQGGIAVVDGDRIAALMPLPIAGILSRHAVPEVAREVAAVGAALRDLGLDHPYWLMRISTFTLPVSSGLRITDLGLVLAAERRLVTLEIE